MEDGGIASRLQGLLTGQVIDIGADTGAGFATTPPRSLGRCHRAGAAFSIERLDRFLFPRGPHPVSFQITGPRR
jgi:hypothetical protein